MSAEALGGQVRNPFRKLMVGASLLAASVGIGSLEGQADGIPKAKAGIETCVRGGEAGNIMLGNLTLVDPTADEFGTIHKSGAPWTETSNLNLNVGQTKANAIVTETGSAGEVCETSSADDYKLIDKSGELDSSAKADDSPVKPVRILETRIGPKPNLNEPRCADTHIVPGESIQVNGTVVDPVAPGFFNVYAEGASPFISSVGNFNRGENTAGTTTVKVPETGRVCIVASQSAHLVLDVGLAFVKDGFKPATANGADRILEVRKPNNPNSETDGKKVPAGQPICRNVGADKEGSIAVVNATAANPNADGFLTVFPDTELATWNKRSTVNYVAGKDVANQAHIVVPHSGNICVAASAELFPLLDLAGYFDPGLNVSAAAGRLTDGRIDGPGQQEPVPTPPSATKIEVLSVSGPDPILPEEIPSITCTTEGSAAAGESLAKNITITYSAFPPNPNYPGPPPYAAADIYTQVGFVDSAGVRVSGFGAHSGTISRTGTVTAGGGYANGFPHTPRDLTEQVITPFDITKTAPDGTVSKSSLKATVPCYPKS